MARAIDADTLDFSNCRIEIIGDTRFLSLRDVANVIKTAPTLTPPNEWVSVEDELPARDGVYLVFTMRGSVTTAHFYAEKTFSDGHRRSANWQGNRKVTHWTPLPEPPDRRPPEGEEDT